jgi:hypothetical protein
MPRLTNANVGIRSEQPRLMDRIEQTGLENISGSGLGLSQLLEQR